MQQHVVIEVSSGHWDSLDNSSNTTRFVAVAEIMTC